MNEFLPRKTLAMEWNVSSLKNGEAEPIAIHFKTPPENRTSLPGAPSNGPDSFSAYPSPRRLLRILMVEDSREDFDLICFHLRKCGFTIRVERVFCEETMRAALQKGEWDIVFTDHGLPGFTGIAAIALLRELDLSLPVLCITGSIDPVVIRQILAAGASACISKDDLSLLCTTIERVLNGNAKDKKTGGKQTS